MLINIYIDQSKLVLFLKKLPTKSKFLSLIYFLKLVNFQVKLPLFPFFFWLRDYVPKKLSLIWSMRLIAIDSMSSTTEDFTGVIQLNESYFIRMKFIQWNRKTRSLSYLFCTNQYIWKDFLQEMVAWNLFHWNSLRLTDNDIVSLD